MVKVLEKITYEEFYKINEQVANSSPMTSHYNSHNPIERWLWKQKKEFIKENLSKLPIKTLIDFGCGDGGLLDVLNNGVHYTGIDISPTQIRNAQKMAKSLGSKNTKFYIKDILKLNLDDDSFDAALACDVVEHVLSPERLFINLKKAVKKNGYIIISIPNEALWEIARAVLFKFPLRSPDHIHAVFPNDVYNNFPNVIKKRHLPLNFSSRLSLINMFIVKNVK